MASGVEDAEAVQLPASKDPGLRSVAVVGLGYVGLPTALAIAESGIMVLGCDISESRLAAIKAKRVDLLHTDLTRLERFWTRRH